MKQHQTSRHFQAARLMNSGLSLVILNGESQRLSRDPSLALRATCKMKYMSEIPGIVPYFFMN
jgi:hypothetical protein